MNMTRREMLCGAAAFSIGGWRLFAAPLGWKPRQKPNLVFGVLSDTHLISTRKGVEKMAWTRGGKVGGPGSPDQYLVSAFQYFKKNNVDAVMLCGDIADQGLVSEMEWTANAWRKVFPENTADDGRKVEKLFVTGNHDVEGMWRVARDIPDEAERKRKMLSTDMEGNWQRIWGEPYEDVWHKEIKGYHFFGRNYGEIQKEKLVKLLQTSEEKYKINQGRKPFFITSHTGYFGNNNKWFREALKKYTRNAVAFYGHYHWSASNWTRIFFMVSDLMPELQCPPCGPFQGSLGSKNPLISKDKIEGEDSIGMCRQGFLVSVYPDMMVVHRRDFGLGGSIGQDWIMPLGKFDPHPFSQAELKKVIGSPQFPKSAKLKIEDFRKVEGVDKTPHISLMIPHANGNPDSRVFAYMVEVTGGSGGRKFSRALYAPGCNLGIGHEPNGGVATIQIPVHEIPAGKTLLFSVKPLSSLGTAGKPITGKIKA